MPQAHRPVAGNWHELIDPLPVFQGAGIGPRVAGDIHAPHPKAARMEERGQQDGGQALPGGLGKVALGHGAIQVMMPAGEHGGKGQLGQAGRYRGCRAGPAG